MAPADSQGRIHLRKLLNALGWSAGTLLVGRVDGSAVAITKGRPATPAELRIAVDPQGRLCLPPPVTGALSLDVGTQVLAAAAPSSGELYLRPAESALAQLFGEAPAPRATDNVTPLASYRSRIRPRFAPDPTHEDTP